jgi:hypothetical protein
LLQKILNNERYLLFFKWLCEKFIHACVDAGLTVLQTGVGGHGDQMRRLIAHLGAQDPRRL